MENERRTTIGEPMIVRNYHIPRYLDEWMKDEARKRGLTTAQLVRDIIRDEKNRCQNK